MPKKFMIRCDMEGASGIVSYDQVVPGEKEYDYGQRLFMSDLDALISGLIAGGADEIHIYDEHYYGRNVLLDGLPDNVFVYCGKPPYLRNWAGGLDESFEGLILLGLHAKSGTPRATLQHTYEHDIRDIVLNGRSVGEIGVETAIAGDYGVPLLMITADSAGVEEARCLVPDVTGVAVKESLCEWGARCLPAGVTSRLIGDKARAIAKSGRGNGQPLRLGPDVQMDIALREGAYLQAYRALFPDTFVSGDTIRLQGANTTAVWADYWQNKLQTLAALEAGQ